MDNETKKIVKVGITGAGGRVGKIITDGLAEKYQLTLFIREKQPDTALNLKIVKVNLSKAEEIKGKFAGLDAVIHLAANPGTRTPWETVLADNIVATYNVLEEARQSGVKRVVFASTNHVQNAAAMGATEFSVSPAFTQRGIPLKLSDPPAPDSYYGVSKLFGEDLGRYYSRFFGLEFISVRIGWAAPKIPPPVLKRTKEEEMHVRGLYLSPGDCVELFIRTLEVKTNFLIVYGLSNTRYPIFDMTETKKLLGYYPKDNEEEYFKDSKPA